MISRKLISKFKGESENWIMEVLLRPEEVSGLEETGLLIKNSALMRLC